MIINDKYKNSFNDFKNKLNSNFNYIFNYNKNNKLENKLYKDSNKNSNLKIIILKNKLKTIKKDILNNIDILYNISLYKDCILKVYNYYYNKLKFYKNNLKFDKNNNSYYIINNKNLKIFYNDDSINKIKYIYKLYKNLYSNNYNNINYIVDKILNYNVDKYENFMIL